MADERKTTQRALDDAIRAHLAHDMDPGDIAVSTLVLVGVRSLAEDGGQSGWVQLLLPEGSMVSWEAKGLLYEALDNLDEYTHVEDRGDDG